MPINMGSTASVAFHQGSSMLRHLGCILTGRVADVCSSSTSFVVGGGFCIRIIEEVLLTVFSSRLKRSIANYHYLVIVIRSKESGSSQLPYHQVTEHRLSSVSLGLDY